MTCTPVHVPVWIDHAAIVATGLDPGIYQRLGFERDTWRPLVVDGIVGPRTEGALYLNPAVELGPIATEAMKDLLAGAQEEGARNDGEWVRGYMRGGPGLWCAGSASTWGRRAHGEDFPYRMGAQRLGRALRAIPGVIEHTRGRDVPADAVLVVDRDGPDPGDDPTDDWSGHVGVVAVVVADYLVCIEGNVGNFPAPVRCFRRHRDDPGSPDAPFIHALEWPKTKAAS